MLHDENTVVIDRPAEDVYDFLVDGLNGPEWRTGIRSIALRSGTIGAVGTEYAQELAGPGGRSVAGDYRITRADRPSRIEFEVIAGPLRPKGTYTLDAEGGGTSVTFALDAQPSGFMRLMSGTIRKTMAAEVGALGALKQVLES
ncbi:SRPBCC family protein [Microbacterium sp. ASV49]|uniref:SRPBCC family protein n=1 Tax=Microbacterium candidum TaxID=3041922 RepID=A0ABT7N2V3_9MICO|nr:SRPBCC family protein [Microbacterium sp. ASV49]MDL9981040.1 SRPBCC family protein [Microbacterium sp. ASV49]